MLRPSKLPASVTPYHAEATALELGTDGGGELGRGPYVEAALLALGVGVLRRAQPAAR